MTVYILMNMPDPPPGYEYTGEYRRAKAGEPYRTHQSGTVEHVPSGMTYSSCPILRRIKPATVSVELPREHVEAEAQSAADNWFSNACRKAIRNEATT